MNHDTKISLITLSQYIKKIQNTKYKFQVKIHFRSKYMGIWGRLRFARKPICVIGEISVAPPKKENDWHQCAFTKVFSSPNIWWQLCNLPATSNLETVSNVKRLIFYTIPSTYPRLRCWTSLSLGHFSQRFSWGGKLQNPFLNISEKQKLIPDLLVVSASIVVLAFGSNGQVSLFVHFPFLNFLSF